MLRRKLYKAISSCYEQTRLPDTIAAIVNDYSDIEGTLSSAELNEVCWCANGCLDEARADKKINSSILLGVDWENVKLVFQHTDLYGQAPPPRLVAIPDMEFSRGFTYLSYINIHDTVMQHISTMSHSHFTMRCEYDYDSGKFVLVVLFSFKF